MMLNSNLIGNKIATARKKLNLSQAELAKQISISPQAVSKWERGESLPDITTLNRLALILRVDLNYFSDSFQILEKEIVTKVRKEEDNVFFKIKDHLGLNWNMSGENYVGADFSGVKNVNDKLNSSSFKQCKLIEADLSDIIFKGNSIKGCDFMKANLRNCMFSDSEIKTNSFVGASLIDSVIEGSQIRDCDFSGANLSGLEISTSEFRNNKIENTIWQHASFKDNQFTEIIFNGMIEDCLFANCSFSKTTFKNATFKKSFFKFSDLKRVTFIDCFADKLSYEFLKNGKANMNGIKVLN